MQFEIYGLTCLSNSSIIKKNIYQKTFTQIYINIHRYIRQLMNKKHMFVDFVIFLVFVSFKLL